MRNWRHRSERSFFKASLATKIYFFLKMENTWKQSYKFVIPVSVNNLFTSLFNGLKGENTNALMSPAKGFFTKAK
jgi:hypothetical protein